MPDSVQSMKMNMKSFLKKLHITPNQPDEAADIPTNNNNKPSDASSSPHHQSPEVKPFSGLSNWLSSVGHRKSPSPPNSLNATNDEHQQDSKEDPEVEEEYQIQLALELSAREDPEAAQIEAMKQFSLGSCAPDNSPAELVAYRYWNYNCLGYDDKILDGFYDLYGVLNASSAEKIPPLLDLQGTPVSDGVTWEAVLVNRSGDYNLLRVEQMGIDIAAKTESVSSSSFVNSELVRKLAVLVGDYMGGPVVDPDSMLRAWRSLSYSLKATLGSMVLPLGSLTIGLARHRALLFKVLCDSVGVPCRIVKGQQYTGSEDVAMNYIKTDDGREYIVDLMGDPGTLIPADAAGLQVDYDEPVCSTSPGDNDLFHDASSTNGIESSFQQNIEFPPWEHSSSTKSSKEDVANVEKAPPAQNLSSRPIHSFTHMRSPSWTEGVSSPAARRMKVKDVSQYMIDAAKENPRLAQKLHDVLLESGVVAPPNLFSEVYPQQLDATVEIKNLTEAKKEKGNDLGPVRFLPPLPRLHSKADTHDQHDHGKAVSQSDSSHSEASSTEYARTVPAAVAAAAVVASSMVAAAAKNANIESSTLELPAAAAATATAAAVVATAAAVSKHLELGSNSDEPQGSGDSPHGPNSGGDRVSDRSTGDESSKSDGTLDDVSDCEILWEEITLGDRIGLGSYGEVYRGDWHGTEVAAKKFLDQDLTGEALEEFRSEVQIMKKLRHPNIVLFMGAVTRPPNLSIITEFLPRGSLYRLIHRPNNQLDERRRLRMALDAARGMNYLHSCSPMIVHRDLKSPNLLVDKNWVVKVCDFGLSRMKNSTYLSSKSTAGTAEWMAPEVLRNEPADEKCDVYSYGVILWELFTLQQPWGRMNAMQVVGAVGFQHRRLDIPDFVDPAIAELIRKCWQTDSKLRPSFAEIMVTLKKLQRPATGSNIPRPVPSASSLTAEQEQKDC
ncbi:PREDICTED: serine/threonine-protein kinase EDR1 [Brassica oleracea var. oleracea]|uniref:non-specific serine/threonine protein kinase n=1 Tax=Brassica oleracea var. oleracea TaxID=109376 RepID=A0A0D3D0E7_BRAOL|nr:PREDICTED: serine/threonine-protein kinase EDR1 [Brassica oleracea var. oleracea]